MIEPSYLFLCQRFPYRHNRTTVIYIYIYARLVSVAWLDLTIANSWYFFLFPLNRSHPTNYGNRAPRSPYWSRVNHALFSYVTVVVSRSPDTRSFDIASREGTVGFFSWPPTPWKPWKRPPPCFFSSLRTDSQPIRFNHELGLDVPLENESVRLLSLTRPFRKERYRRSKVINKASKMKAGYTDLGIHYEIEKLFWDKKKKNEEELRLLVSFDREVFRVSSRIQTSMGWKIELTDLLLLKTAKDKRETVFDRLRSNIFSVD